MAWVRLLPFFGPGFGFTISSPLREIIIYRNVFLCFTGDFFFPFASLSLAQRAFAAALIFALAAAESLRRLCGDSTFSSEPVDGSLISAASCARISFISTILASSPIRARRSNFAGSFLLLVRIFHSSNSVLFVAPGVSPPQMIIGGDRDGDHCDETRSMMLGILNPPPLSRYA